MKHPAIQEESTGLGREVTRPGCSVTSWIRLDRARSRTTTRPSLTVEFLDRAGPALSQGPARPLMSWTAQGREITRGGKVRTAR